MVSCMGTTRFSCTSLAASSGLPAQTNRCDQGPFADFTKAEAHLQYSDPSWHTSQYVEYPYLISSWLLSWNRATQIQNIQLTSLWGALRRATDA